VDCRASYEAPNKCQELGSQGYQQACRGQGASVWNEAWCRSGGAGSEQRRGCGSCEIGSDRSGALVALALGAIGLAALGLRRR
jgi:MYXO-CTERM domain-containing protein